MEKYPSRILLRAWRFRQKPMWVPVVRFMSSDTPHEGAETLDELLDKHLLPGDGKKRDPADREERARLTTTRREVLSLYRDVLRACRAFVWTNAEGIPWGHVLKMNARKEFEEARFEKDPEVIARLLVGGRDAVQAAVDKLMEKHQQMLRKGPGPVDGL